MTPRCDAKSCASFRSEDIDPAHRLLRIRADTTKGRRERILPYSLISGELLRNYRKRDRIPVLNWRFWIGEASLHRETVGCDERSEGACRDWAASTVRPCLVGAGGCAAGG